MNYKAVTIRELDEARPDGGHHRRLRSDADLRECLIAFAAVLACWLVRELSFLM